MSTPNEFYGDGRFVVNSADIRTPSTYYPVGDTVGRLRRDPLYFGFGLAVVLLTALAVYADLWTVPEIIGLLAVSTMAIYAGLELRVLQLDARGFPTRVYLGRTLTMRRIFDAITQARAAATCRGSVVIESDSGDVEV